MGLFDQTPERIDRVSQLRPGAQEDLFSQLQGALQQRGGGGAFGDVSDYYRDLLSGQGAEDFEAPLLRQFREDIMPGIAEQFAGMGAGGLSSGGFMQESGRAGTDLAERLGAIRAGLREKGAAGLQGLAQTGLTPVDEIMFRPRQESFGERMLSNFLPGLGAGAGPGIVSGLSGLAGQAGKLFGNFLKK